MIQHHPASDRGVTNIGWLDSRHTFSFGEYYDPQRMGFRSLRVMNDDRVAAGKGFGAHPHRDMEIISYVLEGSLEHKDSLGNGSVLRAGQLQRMSAGAGVVHSEFNPSVVEPVRFYQVWIMPQAKGIAPSYEELDLSGMSAGDGLRLVASRDGREGSVTIHQDAELWLGRLAAGESVEHKAQPGRGQYVQVLKGSVILGDQSLTEGDGATVEHEASLRLQADSESEVFLFDLA